MVVTKGNRIHIGIFGKRNCGKSSIINKITSQNMSIVSDVLGTTTDPVEKTMEFLPLGPTVFIDTAGIDDNSCELGLKRVKKTYDVLFRSDLAILVCDTCGFFEDDIKFSKDLIENNIPFIVVINKSDLKNISFEKLDEIKKYCKNIVITNVKNDINIVSKIKSEIISIIPEELLKTPSLTGQIVKKGDIVLLVTPIDKEAPKGRLILPQVQTIRDLLDNDCQVIIVKENNIVNVLKNLKKPPKIVITDSQAFERVNKIVPQSIFLTSFSILFANLKGDLKTYFRFAKSIDNLDNGDNILICESCTHHPIEDDIARVKIPALIKKYTKCDNLNFEYFASKGLAENLEKYSLIIQCGGCMTNRREILNRISKAIEKNVPITNYGMAICQCLGILNRAIEPFREEVE